MKSGHLKYEAVTIKDIAKALGVSTSTVSRALHDSYEINPATKDKIKAYISEVQYEPNPIARSLRYSKSQTIGVIVSEINNPFYAQAIDGIESIARSRGYNVIITQTREDFKTELSALKYMASRSVDGVLLAVSTTTTDCSVILSLHKKKFPIVCFDRIIEQLNTNKVMLDNQEAAYKATNYLINQGYKEIGFLGSADSLSTTKERLFGYQNSLNEHHLKSRSNYVQYCANGGMLYKEVQQAMDLLVKQKNKPQAIFASADKLTIGCLRYCKEQDISIPNDLSVVGFCNLDTIDLLSDQLVIIRQPAYEMGEKATMQLINLIESKRNITEFQINILPAELILKPQEFFHYHNSRALTPT